MHCHASSAAIAAARWSWPAQYGGERPGGLPPCGAWCRLPLEDLALNKDPWSPGPSGIPASFGDIELTDYWLEMRPY
jgi:hypothetical protein